MHDLTVTTPAGEDLSFSLVMPIEQAHAYAAAIAGELGATAYTLNAFTRMRKPRIPDALRRAIEAERRWLTDADDCEELS